MRKLLLGIVSDGLVLPPSPSLISLPPVLSPSPSPLPSDALWRGSFFHFPSIFIADSAFDLATLCLITGLLLLSVLSLCFIFHLRLRSRRWHHLQNFNSLWTVRLLLVSFASLWALNEVLRLLFFRRNYLYPYLPPLDLDQQTNLCKVQVVFSLGFLEPGFLVTLLFLVNVPFKDQLPRRMLALAAVCLACSPVFFLQIIVVFFSPLQDQLPKFMHASSVHFTDSSGFKTVLCKYPLFSTLIFGSFAIAYLLAFLISCGRVVSFVINKSIRARINMLASTVMIALPLKILCLALSPLWSPDNPAYGSAVLVMFLCGACSMAVGEVILVIKPIMEALAAGGHCCPWRPSTTLRRSEVDRERTEDFLL